MSPKPVPVAAALLLATLALGCGKGPIRATDPDATENPRHEPYQVETPVSPTAPATLNANGTPSSSPPPKRPRS